MVMFANPASSVRNWLTTRNANKLVISQSTAERIKALQLFAGMGGEANWQRVLGGLRDVEPEVREQALALLGSSACKQFTAQVYELLQDQSPAIRSKAADILAQFGWEAKTDAERAWLHCAHGEFREATILGSEAIKALDHSLTYGIYYKKKEVLEALIHIDDPSVLNILRRLVRSEETAVRTLAIETISKLRAMEDVPLLKQCLKDADPQIRVAGVQALGRFKDAELCSLVLPLMQDGHWEVRMTVTKAIGEAGFREWLPRLALMACDKDKEVREAALKQIEKHAGPEVIEPLIAASLDEETNIRMRAQYILRQADPQWECSPQARNMIPFLKKRLKHSDWWVRRCATETLAAIGEMRVQKAAVVVKRKTPLEVFMEMTQALDNDIRLAGVEALGSLGNNLAVPVLVKALTDRDPPVRRAAADSLLALRWTPATDEEKKDYDAALAAAASAAAAGAEPPVAKLTVSQ